MLKHMQRRSSARRRRSVQPLAPGDASRAATIVKRCREIIKPLAALAEKNSGAQTAQCCNNAGGPEVVGALVRFARIDVSGDALSPAAYARFRAEGEAIMDMLQNTTLNWTVILSLFLTIYVSLAVMHSGNGAYAIDNLAQDPFGADDESSQFLAWRDLASYAWPGDDEAAQAGLRRSFYIGECVCIALGMFFCSSGLLNTLIIYSVFGAAFPDVESKVEFMCDNPNSMAYLWFSFDFAVMVLPLAVGFVTARSSAVMSIAAFSAGGAWALFMSLSSCRVRGIVAAMHIGQAKEARRALHEVEAQAQAAARSSSTVTDGLATDDPREVNEVQAVAVAWPSTNAC